MNLRFSVEITPKDPLWKSCILANLSDSLGFDMIWVSDHFFNRNVFITLAAISEWTRRCIVGPAVVNPYIYHPVTIAQSMATLAELTKNRVALAIGAGDSSVLDRLCIKQERPLSRIRESLYIIRELLGDREISQHYGNICVNSAKLAMKRKYNIPIYIGAQGENMIKLAVKVADGVLVNWSVYEKLEEAIRIINQFRKPSFDAAAYLIVSIHDDVAKARKTAIPFAAYLMTGASRRFLDKLGIAEEEVKLVRESLIRSDWDKLYRIARGDWIDTFSFYGKPKQLEEFTEDIVKLGYRHVVYGGPLGPRVLYSLKQISRIIRLLRRKFKEN